MARFTFGVLVIVAVALFVCVVKAQIFTYQPPPFKNFIKSPPCIKDNAICRDIKFVHIGCEYHCLGQKPIEHNAEALENKCDCSNPASWFNKTDEIWETAKQWGFITCE